MILLLVLFLGLMVNACVAVPAPTMGPSPTATAVYAPTLAPAPTVTEPRRLTRPGYESWVQVLQVSGMLGKITDLLDAPRPEQTAWREELDLQAWLLASAHYEAKESLNDSRLWPTWEGKRAHGKGGGR